ncbi:MAG TPA: CCA tRNA nucleotidyltransferase [Planctomycetaceae bacterium]|nr:CCA tRNA nucleotidyltransferase [Planctomycetaceae bacterium]
MAYFAGGCVRDLLLGRQAKDYDVATNARPDQVRELFGRRKTLAVGESFGVIIVLGPKPAGQVEVATFRTDGEYHDGRRPTHVEFCSPEEDAQRRDFTINGMFYDPIDTRILDYVGGEHDLAARVIRAIGDPHARMTEDKLRMLRAVRFTATLEFDLDPATADAIRVMADQLHAVSAERIAQELHKMLLDRHRRRAVSLCDELGLLRVIFPRLVCPDEYDQKHFVYSPWSLEKTGSMLAFLDEPSFPLALAVLLRSLSADVVGWIGRRLRLSNDEIDRAQWLVIHQDDLRDEKRVSLAEFKRLMSHPYRDDLLAFLRVKLLAEGADLGPVLFSEQFLATTPLEVINPPPLISGNDLIRQGLKPGPTFKLLLEQIRDAQLNEEIATAAEALVLARRLQDSPPTGTP